MGGSKGSQSTTTSNNQTQSYTADPAIRQAGYQALSGAQSAASQPFQMPVAPVAGFSPLQQQAFQQYQALQGKAQPYYDTASSLYQQAAARPDVQSFYNPMADNVTAQLKNIFGQQNTQNTANLVQSAGGVGADRIAVGQGNMANQQGLAAGQTYANLWQQAQQAAQAQQQAMQGSASGLTGLGTAAQNAALQGTSALYGAGTAQQQQSQAELNAPYQNTLAKIAYPFQTSQYLAGITGGLAPALGGITSSVGSGTSTPPSPSIWSQMLGLGTAGAGLLGSTGAFGSQGWLTGSSPSYGGGNWLSGDAWGGSSQNPLPGLTADDYGAGFASGGGVDDGEDPSHVPGVEGKADYLSPIPYIPLSQGTGQRPMLQQPQQQQPQKGSDGGGGGLGDIIGMATKVLPFLPLKRGGSVAGYDDGGDVPYGWGGWGNNPFPATPEATLPPSEEGPQLPPERPEVGPIIRPGSIADKIRGTLTGSGPAPQGAQPDSSQPFTDRPGVQFPSVTGQRPNPLSQVPPVRPQGIPRPSVSGRKAAATSVPGPGTGDTGALPYPDALDRDWGQTATRSPWMALVQAGAAMASTPGPLGVSIAKGLQAGSKSLEDQRKELRSEQQLNDKAKELYQKAKAHLDEYNKMTPYQRASIALRNRELDQSEAGTAPTGAKFTGADYDRAAKFIQSMNPGLPPEQLQPLIDAEVSRRRRALGAAAAAGTQGTAPAQAAGPSAGTISNAKAAIAAGAKIDDVIAKARAAGITLTPDMLQ